MNNEIELENFNETPHMEPPLTTGDNILIGQDGLPHFVEDIEFQNPKNNQNNPLEHISSGDTERHEEGNLSESYESKHLEEEEEADYKKVGTCGTIFNIINSLMGAGILSVPCTFTFIGIIPSIIIMMLIAFLSWLSGSLVLSLLKQTHAVSFDQLAALILGKVGSRILSVLNMLFLLCCLLGFLIIGGDMITSWFSLGGINISGMWPRAIMMAIYGIAIPIALSVPRNIRFLRYFAVGSVFCVCFYCVSMVYKGISKIITDGVADSISYGHFGMGLFSSISIYGLSFAIALVFIPAISMYSTDLKKRKFTSFAAQFLCFLLVAISGLFGYLQFGKDTNSNMLKNYPDDDILIIIVRSCFFIVVSCAYPMISQSVMATYSYMIFNDSNQADLPTFKRMVVLIITHSIPLILAMFLAEAKPALSVGGSLGGCLAQFCFPPWMWIKNSDKNLTHWSNILCIIFIVFGVIVGIISTYQSIVDAINAFK